MQYHVQLTGDLTVPMEGNQVHALLKEGKITTDSMIWREGLPEWVAVWQLREELQLLPPETGAYRQKPAAPTVAKITTKKEQFGKGCLLQAIGLLVLLFSCYFGFLGFICGFIVFIPLAAIGSKAYEVHKCGNCAHKLENNEVRMCPTCKINLSKYPICNTTSN